MKKANSYGRYDFESDAAAFRQWLEADMNPDDDYSRLKRMLHKAIQENLKPKAREYLTAYYFQNLTMEEIAEMHGVNKSTVSRSIKFAEQRLRNVLQYTGVRFANADRSTQKGRSHHERSTPRKAK